MPAYGSNVIGDLPKDVKLTVTALVAPLVLAADLADVDNMINQTHLSGKQKGAYVLAVTSGTVLAPTAYELRSAVGSAPGDAWVAVGGSGAPAYTLPNATPSVRGGVLQSAATADQGTLTVSGADVAALVTSTNTALATLVAKVNAILAAERTAGQKATS